MSVSDLVVDLVMHDPPYDVFLRTVELAKALLHEGNTEVQTSFYKRLKKRNVAEQFFKVFSMKLQQAQNRLKSDMLSGGDSRSRNTGKSPTISRKCERHWPVSLRACAQRDAADVCFWMQLTPSLAAFEARTFFISWRSLLASFENVQIFFIPCGWWTRNIKVDRVVEKLRGDATNMFQELLQIESLLFWWSSAPHGCSGLL